MRKEESQHHKQGIAGRVRDAEGVRGSGEFRAIARVNAGAKGAEIEREWQEKNGQGQEQVFVTEEHGSGVFADEVRNGAITGAFGFLAEVAAGQLILGAVIGDALAAHALSGTVEGTGAIFQIFLLVGAGCHGGNPCTLIFCVLAALYVFF
jgi:hypothetical protein